LPSEATTQMSGLYKHMSGQFGQLICALVTDFVAFALGHFFALYPASKISTVCVTFGVVGYILCQPMFK
jgi:hypothetical protein